MSFSLTSRASSFDLRQHLPTPHLGFSPGMTFQASPKSLQNGFRNKTNLLQGEKSGFIIHLREERGLQEARLGISARNPNSKRSELLRTPGNRSVFIGSTSACETVTSQTW